jgi:hypothetical protein
LQTAKEFLVEGTASNVNKVGKKIESTRKFIVRGLIEGLKPLAFLAPNILPHKS